ncbi:putative transmembrane protein [Senna tora]|uniref:Putative transmembrane protein n=1 Tax=Senna tora TaxID=362788 RepID=A0A834TXG7_9FABA|nr:putative transmembrane protein [Senna tora]
MDQGNICGLPVSTICIQVYHSAWREVCEGITAAKSLDEVIDVHEAYMLSIQRQCFVVPDKLEAPPVTMAHESHNGGSEHESVGPVVGVLVVIMVLGIIAVMIGRLCSGRQIMGHGQYDIESWAERKCSSCIDGRIRVIDSTTSIQNHQETKQPQQSSHNV